MNSFGIKEVQKIAKAANEVCNKIKAFENNNKEVKLPRHINTINEGFSGQKYPGTNVEYRKHTFMLDGEKVEAGFEGFADEIMQRSATAAFPPQEEDEEDEDTATPDEPAEEDKKKDVKASMLFSRKAVNTSLINKLRHRMIADAAKTKPAHKPQGRSVDELRANLETIKNYI